MARGTQRCWLGIVASKHVEDGSIHIQDTSMHAFIYIVHLKLASLHKLERPESVKHLQFKDDTSSKLKYVHLHDQRRWLIDVLYTMIS